MAQNHGDMVDDADDEQKGQRPADAVAGCAAARIVAAAAVGWRLLACLWLWAAALTGTQANAQPVLVAGPDGLWPVVTLDRAQIWPGELGPAGVAPASADAISSETITLPDDWSTNRPQAAGVLRYRLAVDIPQPGPQMPLLAAYIERVCLNFEVRLNGHLLADGGPMAEPLPRHCYHPQLVTLPSSLLVPGINHLEIRVGGVPLSHVAARQRAPGLSAVQVGPQDLLTPVQERRFFWNVTVAQVIGGTVAALGLLMLALGLVRVQDSYFLYFGLLSVGWALVTTRLYVRHMPYDTATTEAIICALYAPVSAFAVQFLLRYGGLVVRGAGLVLLAQCIVVPLLFALAGPAHVFTVARAAYTVFGLEVAAAAGWYLWHARAQRPAEFRMMAVLLTGIVVLVMTEVLIQMDWFALPRIHVIHYAMPLLFLAIGFRLIQLFVEALNFSEQLNRELEQRVAEKSSEIEQSYLQIAQMRAEHAAIQERKRIAADLHDDLGAKLLTIAHISDSERVSELARQALDEMRLAVRGLTGMPVLADDAVADWRSETVARLHAAGIEVEWEPGQNFGALALPARTNLHATRILREAVSNVIRHSGATLCRVRCRSEASGSVTVLELVIEDNGKGLSRAAASGQMVGQGLAGMKRRAKQLRGQCLIEYRPGHGTSLTLRLPLPTPVSTAAWTA